MGLVSKGPSQAVKIRLILLRLRKLETRKISAGHTIADEGTPLPSESTLNIVGDLLTATDDPGVATVITSASFGTGAGNVPQGNDSRFSDARTPTAHHASHETGGSDPIAALAASVITTGTMATARLGSGSATSSTFLRGDQTYATPSASPSGLAIFGDGSDGTVTITTNTTLTRDMFYDTLQISSSALLNTGGYRVFVKNTLTIDSGCTIHRNGNNGVGTTGGAALATNNLGNGTVGAGGGLGTFGGSAGGNNTSAALGGAGGKGGNGGIGGTVTAPLTSYSSPRYLPNILGTYWVQPGTIGLYNGGAGGGSGASSNNYLSGSGGSGAGVVGIYAKTIVNNGTISANGGNGSNAANSSGSGGGSGGGAGGGGGLLLIVSTSTNNGTVTAAGGIGGTLFGTGPNAIAGANGSAGTVIWLVN